MREFDFDENKNKTKYSCLFRTKISFHGYEQGTGAVIEKKRVMR